MSRLCIANNFISVGSKSTLKVFSIKDGSCAFSYTHAFDKEMMDGNNKPLDERLEDICASSNGKYLCAIYSDKRLLIICAQEWIVLKEIKAKRRPTAMCFHRDGERLLVADKSGDLYQYDVSTVVKSIEPENDNEKEQPVLGHVSMLLDVKVTIDGKYILTADRDEKIRVSESENPYVIESYCLGHSEFVCKLEPIPSDMKTLFLSASGDGTVRLWDAKSGKEYGKHIFGAKESNGHDLGKDGSQLRVVPSTLACSPNGKFFVVASTQQTSLTEASIFGVTKQDPSFIANITFPNCDRIADIKFGCGDDSNMFYVLGAVGNGDGLRLFACTCEGGECRPLENMTTLDSMNTQLRDFLPEFDNRYQSLFKIRCEGEPYASYHKKKEERLATSQSNKGGNENGTAAKRAKLEGQS